MSGRVLWMKSDGSEYLTAGRGYFQKLPPLAARSSNETKFRAGNPKSRSGCIVCKIRHVKCDEEKPFCKRCTSTGRVCEGYANPVPKRERPIRPLAAQTDTSLGSITLYIPSLDVQEDTNKRRSFHYFRSRNIGNTPANLEPYFWDHQLLQFSHQSSVILDCVIALSATYEARDSRTSSGRTIQSRYQYAVGLYSKALKNLINYISSDQQDLRITLICCVVFVCIEHLQGNFEGGLRHLRSGLKILQRARCYRIKELPKYPQNGSDVYNDLDKDDVYGPLERLFSRLSIHTMLHGGPTTDSLLPSSINSTTYTGNNSLPTKMPHTLKDPSLATLQDWLNDEMDSMLVNFKRLRDANLTPVYSEVFSETSLRMVVTSIPNRMEHWKSATERTTEPINAVVKPAAASILQFLRLYRAWVVLILRAASTPLDVAFAESTSDFEQMLTSAASLIHTLGTAQTSLLCFDMGIIPPLYFVALKCPVFRLRRQAIKLLKEAPEQEGLWRRDIAVEHATWKLEMEEQGMATVNTEQPRFVRTIETIRDILSSTPSYNNESTRQNAWSQAQDLKTEEQPHFSLHPGHRQQNPMSSTGNSNHQTEGLFYRPSLTKEICDKF